MPEIPIPSIPVEGQPDDEDLLAVFSKDSDHVETRRIRDVALTGERGEKGDKGDTGDVGPQGQTGPQGETGPQGDTGDAGQQGERGETGQQGEIGPAGTYTEGDGIDISNDEISVDDDYIRGLSSQGDEFPVHFTIRYEDNTGFPDGTDAQWTVDIDAQAERIKIRPPGGLATYISDLESSDKVQIRNSAGVFHRQFTLNADATGPDTNDVYTLTGTFSDSPVLVSDRDYVLLFSHPADPMADHIGVDGSVFDRHLAPTSGSPTNNVLQALHKIDDIKDLEKVHITSVSTAAQLNAIDVVDTVAFAHIDGNFTVNSTSYRIGQVWIWDTEGGTGGEWTIFLEDVRDHLRGEWASDQQYVRNDFVTIGSSLLYIATADNMNSHPELGTNWLAIALLSISVGEITTGTSTTPRIITAEVFNQAVTALLPTLSSTDAEAGTATDRRAVTAAVLRGAIYAHAPTVVRLTAAQVANTDDDIVLTPTRTFTSYTHGMIMIFNTKRNNDGAVTVAVSSLAARALVKSDGSAFTSGQLSSGQTVEAVYNSGNTRFEAINISPAPTITATAMAASEAIAGTATDAKTISASVLRSGVRAHAPIVIRATADEVTNTTDAIVINPARAITSYTHGLMVIFKTEKINAGAVTINISSQGAKDLRNEDGTAFAATQLPSGAIVVAIFDNDNDRFDAVNISMAGRFTVVLNDNISYDSDSSIDLQPPGGRQDVVGDIYVFQYARDRTNDAATTDIEVGVNGSTKRRIKYVSGNTQDEIRVVDIIRYNIYMIYRAGNFWQLVGGTRELV